MNANKGYPHRGQQRPRDKEFEWDMPTKKGGWQEYKGQAPPNHKNAEKPQRPVKNAQEEEQKMGETKSFNYEYKEYKTLNSLRLVTLSNEGVSLFQLNPNTIDVMETLQKEEGMHHYPGAEIAKFSPIYGKHLAVVDFAGIHIIDVESKQELRIIEKKGIIALEWSPKGTFLITCTKFKEGSNNLEVWSAETGGKIFECEWKISAKEGPKSLKFDENERFCARQVGKNIIEVFENGNFEEPKLQIRSKLPPLPKLNGEAQEDTRVDNSKFDGFIFCPIPSDMKDNSSAPMYLMAWQNGEVLSETEDNGLVYVYDLNSSLQRPKFNIACPRAQNIQILPAPSGHAILVWAQNLNDSSGKSYYGEHNLQYIRVHKGKTRCFIPIFDNQIQDVKWTHSGENFLVVSGQQPATPTMYDADGQPICEFGKRFRNTIRICPFDNYLMLGGFGNITKGEMDLWTLDSQTEIGKGKAPCATKIDWSACGRYLLTCVLHERLKVDNSFMIYRANGTKAMVKAVDFQELHSAEWQPFPPGVLSKPSIEKIKSIEVQTEAAKPKRIFKFGKGGENTAFQQMMRQ